jgi:hypothetical protein
MHSIMNMKRFAFALTFASILVSANALMAQAPGGRSAPPDLSGFWINQYTPNLAQVLGKQPPFTALGAERWRTVDTAKDPTGVCLPPGPSRAFTAPFPFLLIQHKDMIGILYEYQTIWRVIYTDGRPHPKDIADYPLFMGDSIGHWEGGKLVVDTVGIDERSWLDTAGHEHSDKLHLIETFEKLNSKADCTNQANRANPPGSCLKYTVTFDDPVFFTKPFTLERIFSPGDASDRILPYTCTDNNRDVDHLQPNQPNLNYKHEDGK